MRATPLSIVWFLGKPFLIYGALINITVDDWLPNRNTNEQLTFTSAWKIGQDCTSCVARPDPKMAHQGSWHDTTYNENSDDCNQRDIAFLTFNGSALYVYGIQGRIKGNPTSNADLSIFIDDQLYINNSRAPKSTAEYTYNVLLFAIDSLPLQPHTFKLQNGRHGGGISTVLLDYFIYTTDYSPPSNTTSSPSASRILSSVRPTSSVRPSSLPPELTPPNTPRPRPSESTGVKVGASSRTTAVFIAAICIGILLVTFLVWRGVTFYLRRRVAAQQGKQCDANSVVGTIAASSRSRTSQISEHHTLSIDALSNTCVAQTEINSSTPHTPARFQSLAKRTEKLQALIYKGIRSSRQL